MSRGDYEVNRQPRVKNEAWKSCLCTILVVATICIILTLIVLPYKRDHYHPHHSNHSNQHTDHFKQESNENSKQLEGNNGDKFGKLVIATENSNTEDSSEISSPTTTMTTEHHVRHYGKENAVNFTSSPDEAQIELHDPDENIDEKVCSCNTKTCLKASAKMVSLIDFEENPCEDFYSYSCNGIDDDQFADVNPRSKVWKKIKQMADKIPAETQNFYKHFNSFYKSCVDLKPELVHSVISSDISFCSNVSTAPSFNETVTDLLKRNFAPFFDIQVDVQENSKRFHLTIIPGSLHGIFQKSFEESQESNCPNRDSKSDYLTSINETLLDLKMFDPESQELQDILTCLRDHLLPVIEKIRPSSAEIDFAYQNKLSTLFSLYQLQTEFPLISWDFLFQSLFVECTADTLIEVYFLDNLKEVFDSIANIDEKDLHNSLMAMLIHKLYKEYVLDYSKVCDKEDFCLKLASNLMPEIASVLYMDSFSKKEITENDNQVKDIFNRVLITLKNEMEGKNWFPETEKGITMKLLNDIELLTVGKFPPWSNRQFLEDRMSNINGKSRHFILSVKDLELHRRMLNMGLFDSDPKIPENTWTFFTTPHETKPALVPELQRIILPLGYAMDVDFSADSPKYLQMSETGFKLAKVIIQYLQKSGVTLYKKTEDKSVVKNITYEKKDAKIFNFSMNLTTLKNDQLVDYLATKLAFLSYDEMAEKNEIPFSWINKNIDQLFLINVAQQFCSKLFHIEFDKNTVIPKPVEANSLAANFEKFYEAFSCEKPLKMKGYVKLLPFV